MKIVQNVLQVVTAQIQKSQIVVVESAVTVAMPLVMIAVKMTAAMVIVVQTVAMFVVVMCAVQKTESAVDRMDHVVHKVKFVAPTLMAKRYVSFPIIVVMVLLSMLAKCVVAV